MSFIAIAPSSANRGANAPEPVIIENDGWFPDINLTHMRDAMRLDGTVTDPRLAQAVVEAMLNINNELAEWKVVQAIENAHATLANVPASTINRESTLLIHYRRAVYSTAKADLAERYRDFDTTASSLADKKSMDALNDMPSDQRRNATWAVMDILGRPHSTVELI
jgi:hypothetical protein